MSTVTLLFCIPVEPELLLGFFHPYTCTCIYPRHDSVPRAILLSFARHRLLQRALEVSSNENNKAIGKM